MIKLAKIFSDNMILQRNMPIALFGESDSHQLIHVYLNGQLIAEDVIEEGKFSILLPPQEAIEDAELRVNDLILKNVDIGEIWVAGGQSNMEFWMKYEMFYEQEKQYFDPHLRMYTVGQYSFEGERELGFKSWNQWDRWVSANEATIPEMSAIGYYFAKEMRKKGIPVGIISSNWGGTSAVSWTPKEALLNNDNLKFYVDSFNEIVAQLDIDKYFAIKNAVRPILSSKKNSDGFSHVLLNTYLPRVLEAIQNEENSVPKSANWIEVNGEKINISELTYEEMTQVGPLDVKEPGVLFEQMIDPIAGYSVHGVLWYQGESDCDFADKYYDLFGAMVESWRKAWVQKNESQTYLPFYVVQLAPFGEWLGNEGSKFVKIREQQEKIADELLDNYLISSSDVGNIFDIHPKNKKVLAERLFNLVNHIEFNHPQNAKPPRAIKMENSKGQVMIEFENCNHLLIEPKLFDSYNGFDISEIPAHFIPPITGGVNGLSVRLDNRILCEMTTVAVDKNKMIIYSDEVKESSEIIVEFAKTSFFEVNLYNENHHPVLPFVLSNKEK